MSIMPADRPTLEAGLIAVRRTARYYTFGGSGRVREVWMLLHGYAQRADEMAHACAALEAEHRLCIAPEGLSRFYRRGAEARVPAASWMTRHDRLEEIDDYLAYLDAVYAALAAPHVDAGARLVVLGFSQGAATACRWAEHAARTPDGLVLWGGGVPPEIDTRERAATLARAGLRFVVGDADPLVPPARVAEERARLEALGCPAPLLTYPGSHAIDADALVSLAADV